MNLIRWRKLMKRRVLSFYLTITFAPEFSVFRTTINYPERYKEWLLKPQNLLDLWLLQITNSSLLLISSKRTLLLITPSLLFFLSLFFLLHSKRNLRLSISTVYWPAEILTFAAISIVERLACDGQVTTSLPSHLICKKLRENSPRIVFLQMNTRMRLSNFKYGWPQVTAFISIT